MRSMSNPKYLERSIAPDKVMAFNQIPQIQGNMEGWVDPTDPVSLKVIDGDNEVKPQRAFPEPLPI
eukprot:714216-Heterocapsa_arctica.AAC.1